MSKKRKYSEDYVAFGFTYVTDSDGSERSQCFLCGKVLANASLKPAKLREHLTSIHLKNALNSVNSFVLRRLDLTKLGLCRGSGSSRRRSLASKHHKRVLTALPRKKSTYDRRDIGKTVYPGND